MTLEKDATGTRLTIVPDAELDTIAARELEGELRMAIDGVAELVFDLREVNAAFVGGTKLLRGRVGCGKLLVQLTGLIRGFVELDVAVNHHQQKRRDDYQADRGQRRDRQPGLCRLLRLGKGLFLGQSGRPGTGDGRAPHVIGCAPVENAVARLVSHG